MQCNNECNACFYSFKILFRPINSNIDIMEARNSSTPSKHNDQQNDSNLNFNVVKRLKNTEEQYVLLKNRINILKINDERNAKKILNNVNQIEKLQMIRSHTNDKNNQLGELRKARQIDLEEQRKKNKQFKQSITSSTHAHLESMKSQKAQNYEQLRKQSKTNQRRIQHLRIESVEQRRRLHEQVALAESRSKQNVIDYSIRKHQTLHQQQEKQNMVLNKKKDRKLAQIKKLQKIEMEMVKKYSQSHYVFNNVKSKLDEILGQSKNNKSPVKKPKDLDTQPTKSQSFYALNQKKQGK